MTLAGLARGIERTLGAAGVDIDQADIDAVVQVLDPTRPIAPMEQASTPVASAPPAVTDADAASTRSAVGSAAVAAATGSPSAADPAPAGFVREGLRHILTGYDHMLFLLCLLLPAVMRRTATGWQHRIDHGGNRNPDQDRKGQILRIEPGQHRQLRSAAASSAVVRFLASPK